MNHIVCPSGISVLKTRSSLSWIPLGPRWRALADPDETVDASSSVTNERALATTMSA